MGLGCILKPAPVPWVVSEIKTTAPLSSLKLWAENYRVGDVDAIVKSIVRFGFNSAVRVWRGTVVAGNHSVKALGQIKATGLAAPGNIGVTDSGDWLIPIIDVSALSWLEAKAFAVADNRTSDLAENDPERLSLILKEFDSDLLAATGYELGDIEDLIASIETPATVPVGEDPGPVDPDTITESRVKPGEVWQLDDHRLMCGDSTSADDLAILMDGQLAKLLATDPPYVVKYTGDDRPSQGKDWSNVYREIDITDGREFFTKVFTAVAGFVDERAAWYCFHGERWAPTIVEIWASLGIHWHQTIIWVKPTLVPSFAAYSYQHEPCLMGWRKGKKPRLQALTPQPSTVWQVDWEGKMRVSRPDHPTQKPIDVFGIPMQKHLRKGEICLEPFSGSGSQLIAGETYGMRVRAMEIQPIFCEAAIRRWEQMTQRQAVRLKEHEHHR